MTNKNHDKFIKAARNIAANPPNRNLNEFRSMVVLISLTKFAGIDFLLLLLSRCNPSSFLSSLSNCVMMAPVSSQVAHTVNVPGCRRLQITFARPLTKIILDEFIKPKIKIDSSQRKHKECTNHSVKQLHSLVILRSLSLWGPGQVISQ